MAQHWLSGRKHPSATDWYSGGRPHRATLNSAQSPASLSEGSGACASAQGPLSRSMTPASDAVLPSAVFAVLASSASLFVRRAAAERASDEAVPQAAPPAP